MVIPESLGATVKSKWFELLWSELCRACSLDHNQSGKRVCGIDRARIAIGLAAGVLVFCLGLRRYESGNLLEMRG